MSNEEWGILAIQTNGSGAREVDEGDEGLVYLASGEGICDVEVLVELGLVVKVEEP